MNNRSLDIKITLFFLMILIGCSSQSQNSHSEQARLLDSLDAPQHIRELDSLAVFRPDPEPISTVHFKKELQVGTITPQLLPVMGGVPVTAVDEMGRIYRADRWRNTIYVYNSEGDPVTEIGRRGRGPGEFTGIAGIYLHDNRLVTYDFRELRIQTFTLDSFRLSNTIPLRATEWNKIEEVRARQPNSVIPLTDSAYLVNILLKDRDGRSYSGFYEMDRQGSIMSRKVVEQQRLLNHQWTLDNGMVGGKRLPFTSKGIVEFSDNGTIYHANTSEFLIKILDPDGQYQRAIYHPRQKRPLEENVALQLFHPNLRSRMRDAPFPDYWPILESMLVDDENRIWVATLTEDREIYEWWILNNSGELLANFTWPRKEKIEVLKDGKMYVEVTDEETMDKSIVRYDIDMRANE